ncbi:hypothetical protein ACUXV3_15100 [Roseobacteraceae bacterium NS-SX3]
MAQRSRPAPHRKFIALILAAAIAVTGFSAAPARADNDVAKVLAGLALLGIVATAIKNRKDDGHAVSRSYQPHQPYNYTPPRQPVKPLPPAVARYDLPASCLKVFPRYSRSHGLLGKGCLKKRYGHEHTLPQECRVTFWNGRRHHTGYKPGCLRHRGYRLVQR